jgi:hypothetical protein
MIPGFPARLSVTAREWLPVKARAVELETVAGP